jgi:pheromone shutdown protein TraB
MLQSARISYYTSCRQFKQFCQHNKQLFCGPNNQWNFLQNKPNQLIQGSTRALSSSARSDYTDSNLVGPIHTEKASYYILGTPYLDVKTAAQVEKLIDSTQPTIVMLEISEQYYDDVVKGLEGSGDISKASSTKNGNSSDLNNSSQSMISSFFNDKSSDYSKPRFSLFSSEGMRLKIMEQGLGAIYSQMKAQYSQFSGGLSFGQEFSTAIKLGLQRNACLVCADKPLRSIVEDVAATVSMEQIQNSMLKGTQLASAVPELRSGSVPDFIEKLRQKSIVGKLKRSLGSILPELSTVLISEREERLYSKLLQCEKYAEQVEGYLVENSQREKREKPVIVALIGMQHLEAFEERLKQQQQAGAKEKVIQA